MTGGQEGGQTGSREGGRYKGMEIVVESTFTVCHSEI